MATPATILKYSSPYQVGESLVMYRQLVFGDGTADGVAAEVDLCEIPANVRVVNVRAAVSVAFNGTTDLLSVGYTGDVDAFITTAGQGDITNAGMKESVLDTGADQAGRAGQTAAWTLKAYLETQAGTSAGTINFIVECIAE